jgi:multiple sugar transport system substrate-binding protein
MTVRLFNSFVWQQGSNIISDDGRTAQLDTPEALRVAEFMKSLYDEGLTNKAHDYAAAEQAFLNGEAGILVNGTWAVDKYNAQVASGADGLQNYRIADMPPIFGKPAVWADSHMWVIPTDANRPPEEREAAIAFLKFLNDNNYEWSRTGHLSVRQSVLDSPEFKALPHRTEYAGTAEIATTLPQVQNQRAIQDAMLSEITAIWLAGVEPADALASTQARVQSTLRRAR